ncbi:MAG: hypothetical protein EOO56_01435 [Hymenobacter sp.]|nr:MAG: hypothetical protein EOO56_01435 [Hymenobacter sp.]
MTRYFLLTLASRGLLLSGTLLLATYPAAAQAPGKAKPGATAARRKAPASAQEAPPPPPAQNAEDRANALTANMTTALSLTPAQVEKVRAINATSVRNVESARQRFGQEPAKLRGYIADIGLARLDQLKDVLTPTQFNRYQQKREEKMGIPSVKGYQGTPPPGLGSNGRGGDE